MTNGRIKERGTHSELMMQGTEYSRLIQKHHSKAESEDNDKDDMAIDEDRTRFQRSLSTVSSRSNASGTSQLSEEREQGKVKGHLKKKENVAVNKERKY